MFAYPEGLSSQWASEWGTDGSRKTRIPRMELMPTASRYLLDLKSFKNCLWNSISQDICFSRS